MGGHTPASPNAGAVDAEFATRGGNGTPDLHDAADEIGALHVAKRSLVAKQRGTGPRPIAATAASWLQRRYAKVGLDGDDGTGEVGDGRGQLIRRHR
jgi:hypothetical protein